MEGSTTLALGNFPPPPFPPQESSYCPRPSPSNRPLPRPSISSPDLLTPSDMDTSTSSASTEKSCGGDCEQLAKLDQSMLEDQKGFEGPPSKKRCSRSLDAAVAKLNDIQKTKNEPLSPTPSSTSICPPAPRIPPPSALSSTTQLPLWASSMQLDPQSYLALISRLVQSSMPAVPPPVAPVAPVISLPPPVAQPMPSPRELSAERRVPSADLDDDEDDQGLRWTPPPLRASRR
ncbi:hypothetical protein PMAYCL1PPCAC_32874 [Pristionchus mayeri]|uniref:Uncharacterized protein n=1 Tax=Pristionchus mayeri TaxID=1317129 RepID=A0AAN5DIG2_9BILA|nr:hypothetical protein PMAYCL1PPCAC_32874 [Pristionchus mayeri]